jgi:hypothetical protein
MVKVDISEKYIRMCSLAKEIQHKWSYENGDYVYDTIDGDAGVWYWHHTKDVGECIWLPKQDQLQELCINFYVRIMAVSEYDAFVRLLESYSSWLRDVHSGGYQDVDTFEQLMLSFAMGIMYDRKWNRENWVKAHKGFEPKPGVSLSVNR